jgi:hypothetical protein
MPKKLLTEEDLAKLWGVAPTTLANQRWRGDGPPFIKLGRLVRYDSDVADAWAAARMFRSTSEAA